MTMNKARNRKFKGGKSNRSQIRPANKKRNKDAKPVNKKALFNRYRNKDRVDEELSRKRKLDDQLKLRQVQQESSESEEEVTSYQQLLSTFNVLKRRKHEVVSESEEESENNNYVSDQESVNAKDDVDQYELSENEIGQNEGLGEEETESAVEDEEENVSDSDLSTDPFMRHLHGDLDDCLLVALTSSPLILAQHTKAWPQLGNLQISIPQPIKNNEKQTKKVKLLEEKIYTKPGTAPKRITNVDYTALAIKTQIQGNLTAANKTNLVKNDLDITENFTPLQKELFSVINNYQDLYYPERTFSNGEEIRFTYCLHALNHMLKTRTKILHHNAKLSNKDDVPDEFRDQGLVRPTVLILVPFKDGVCRVVKTLIDILVPKESGQVVNKNRFDQDFTGGELVMPKKNPKPEDYELLFSGNSDDTFRIGMTITKKTLKLYTDFYSSDILIASPLGLRTIIGAEGEPERDFDFLASIELLILDQTDVFSMQNWDHLLHVLDHMHLQPKQTHGTDFSRVRSWAVNGWSKYYRQSLIFSSVALPEISALFNKRCYNYAGRVRVANPPELGTVRHVTLQVPQLFRRFDASSPLSSADERFDFFVKDILPRQRDTLMAHTLVYVPSYFDFVRIRNYFKKEDIGFVQICEYSKDAKIARARDMFFHTEAHFLLYSERAHFFRRFRIKGIRHIVFYQPPTYPHFYSELCNLMQEANQNKYGGSEHNMSVTVLYCRYDLPRIAAILGSTRTTTLAQADKAQHMFVTGE